MIRLLLCLLLCSSSFALAVAADEQVASLGGEVFTPVGAERAGNADGSIPPWAGGLSEMPAGDIDSQGLIDPFAGEKELFRISAANIDDYADKLSPGQVALLRRYPDSYYYPVYPGHRIAAYPQEIYDRVKASATEADMVEGGNGLANLNGTTVPFPFPKLVPVQASGVFAPVIFRDRLVFASSLPPGETDENRLFLYLSRIMAPARLEGDVQLVHENIDQKREPRNAWIYNAGQRRVRRAPNLAYDGPGFAADGLSTTDDLDSYNGAPDRYDWKLLGKRELYVPTNAYRLHSKQLKYSDLIMRGHINPQHTRYELRRVWEVEATLKENARHVYGRRVFYVDEDTWGVMVKDQYDGRGELWRVGQGHAVYHYNAKVPWGSEVMNDLVSGRYLVTGLDNEVPKHGYIWGAKSRASEFTPAALRRAGRR
jgi:hypothetical protein